MELRAPVAKGESPVVMHTVTSIPVAADATTQLVPNSYHLLISGTGPMHDGKDIQLTLNFAHGGAGHHLRARHQPAERRRELLPELGGTASDCQRAAVAIG